MERNELLTKARDLYNKAAASEDAEERKDLMAKAGDLVERADAAEKAAGIPQPEQVKAPVKQTPSADKLRDIMANAGYSDADAEKVIKAMSNNGGDPVREPTKEYTFGEFLKAARRNDQAALKAMGSRKDMEEGDGVSGGYTVPQQQLTELLKVPDSEAVVRPRARKIPMRSRTLTIPILDQGDTGHPHPRPG